MHAYPLTLTLTLTLLGSAEGGTSSWASAAFGDDANLGGISAVERRVVSIVELKACWLVG